MDTLLRLLFSRSTLVVMVAAGLGFAAVTCVATRPPDWRAWAGETTIAVQESGAAPAPERVSLRAGEATAGRRGAVQGDRLVFSGLSADTAYVLEWRAGPFVSATLSLRTLPPVLPLVELDVHAGAGELVVRPSARDARLAEVELGVAAGATPLAARDGGFVVPLPAGEGSVELSLTLPGTGEGHPLELPVHGPVRLAAELSRAENELEGLLAGHPAPAFVELSALERWQPAPLPARRPTATGGPALLAHLRRLAPLVRATVAGPADLAMRWQLAGAASRLAAAEVLARKHQQPNLGVLDWAADLVRYAAYDERVRRRTRMLNRHPVHLVHPQYEKTAEASMMSVVGGTTDSTIAAVLELPPLDTAPADRWVGLSFIFEAIFNSGPPRLTFPRAGVALDLPLVTRGPNERIPSYARAFPTSAIDVWVRKLPADVDWARARLEATWKERSKRVSPCYVRAARFNVAPPK